MARVAGKAPPKQVTWIIFLILYVVALLINFGAIPVSGDIAQWSWVIGYGGLLFFAGPVFWSD